MLKDGATPFRAGHYSDNPPLARVLESPRGWLENLRRIHLGPIVASTWRKTISDHLFGHAAELSFYFLFALFPTLFCAGSILGLAARSANHVYDRLLDYLALVIPTSALNAVLQTFNEMTTAASSGKITFGTIGAVWSASAGVSAIQDTLNAVYKLEETRSYLVARVYAIGLTLLLMVIWSSILASLLIGDIMAAWSFRHIHSSAFAFSLADGVRVLCWLMGTVLLEISFAVLYSWAPNWKARRWRMFTPGTAIGILGWLLSSLGFRIYLHYFNYYTLTYGSLGAVVILLTWFYISGLMLLLGAEIDSEIDAAVQKG